MSNNRRDFFTRLTSLSASFFAGRSVLSAQQRGTQPAPNLRVTPGDRSRSAGHSPVPVTTLDVGDLPFTIDNGIKVFHLVAEPVKQVIVPGRTFDLWGFNGSAPGPTVQANEGDRVRIVFDNHLPEATGIHWHGLELPIEMDGVPGVGQEPVKPGERFIYEFSLHQNGTFFYHPHMAMQEMVGMLGGFIIHPKTAYAPHVDRDYLIALQEYAVLPNSSIPNSMSMEFNWLTFNGKAGPASTPLIIRQGERVRIRLINMGMDHHPIHLHGFTFWETGREGARQQESAWTRGNTTLVGVAQARDIEFTADRLGDWMLHCHLPHHMMNQMSSNVGPMTRIGRGMQAGASMKDGMGMLRDGHATSENHGPSLGRSLGVGSTSEMPMTNGPLMPKSQGDPSQTPLFPQDAFMEGPMMAMDKEVDKPETYGLPPGWSGFVGGMMTLVRVMPPEQYDKIMALKAEHLKAQQETRGDWRLITYKTGGALFIVLCVFSSFAGAQQHGRKGYTLRGTVKQVDTGAKRLSVTNEAIPGGMGAMTMNYAVDKEDVLTRVKAGDHIIAKYYEGDLSLYDVQIAPVQPAPEPKTAVAGLRLEDLEAMALAHNPTMAQVQANVRMSAGLARQAGLYPNPTVGYYGDEIRGGYTGGGKQGGFISQTILTGGKLRAARRVGEVLNQQAATTGEAQRLRILNNVRMSFYEILAGQRLVEVRQKLSQLAADATQTSHQLANIGQADRPDVLQAEVEQQQVNVSLRIARQNLQSSWRMLAAVIGKPDLAPARLEGDLEGLPDLDYEEWLATTLRESPEIKIAQQAIDRAEASLVQARKAPIPDLQLYGNLSQNNELLETTHKPIGLNGGVQIGVQVPIFNRNQGGIAAAKAETEIAKQELLRVKLQISREVANLFRDYESARATVQQYKNEMLPRAEQAYKLYQANYQKMSAAYPQALISQRTLFQLEVDYVQALESTWQGAIGIRGFGLMDGLSGPIP